MWISRETLWQLYNNDPEIKITFLTVILFKIKIIKGFEPVKNDC